MAILNQPVQESNSGFEKKFEAGSEVLLMEFVQASQYMYPVKSAVREIATNAIDSIREKQRFFDIHTGRAKIEDFYVEREGELYKDSKYDPTYYNEAWLSKTLNTVKIIYKANGNNQRDTLHIIDTGVGLGGMRLEKHFNPLYSTKRLNKQDLGKFGLGSKAGLSLQTDYYTVISRYNGAEFQFNVYEYKVDPIIPKFDMQAGKPNPHYETQVLKDKDGNPLKFYYLPTDKPNGVEVILQVKKGLRKEFFDAVKGQLLYLDGVEFEVHEEDGTIVSEPVKAKIEYEDDIFVLPTADSTYYSKPHLILNDVCYGYINFLQMEEEDRAGNIGIKIDPSLVDVTPNRESVRWTERTTNAIHDTFKQGESIAERLINEALVSNDIIDWLMKSAAAMGGANQNSIIGRFAQIVDVKNMKPKFSPMPKIKFSGTPDIFFSGYDVELVTPKQKFSKARQMHIPSLQRESVYTWSTFNSRTIIYQDSDRTDFRKEMFMLSLHPEGFIKLTPKGRVFELKERPLTKAEQEMLDISWEKWKELPESKKFEHWKLSTAKFEQDRALMDQLIRDSKFTDLYSSVSVPEGFSVYEKDDEEDAAEAIEKVMKEMSDAERRKLENKIVVHGFKINRMNDYRGRYKAEPKIKEILNAQDTIIYGFQDDEENLALAGLLLHKPDAYNQQGTWYDEGVEANYYTSARICMISQQNAKYFKHHMFVEDFFMSFNPETKTISMHNKLVKWQTARKIKEGLAQLEFLTNFQLFDGMAAGAYLGLKDYVNRNYINLDKTEHIQDLMSYADKVMDFQLFVAAHQGNDQAIAARSAALFGTNEEGSFKDAVGIELDIYQKFINLLEHISDIQLLLNQIDCLTSCREIPYNLEREIKEYLNFKGYKPLTTVQPVTPPLATAESEAA